MSRPILGHRFAPPRTTLAFGVTLALVLGPALGLGASDRQEEKRYTGGGYDFLTTDPKGTYFNFTGEFALPEGFFDRGSARFDGQRIAFKGVPLRTFKGQQTGNADTVIERKSRLRLGSSYPSRGTTDIEVVALSLASVQPIQVKAYRKTQLWDVRLQLSPSRPSRGKLTLVQQNERGGVFDSELTVFGLFKFVRRGDRATRSLDVGTLRLGRESLENLRLRATGTPWENRPPRNAVGTALSGGFYPGVANGLANPFSEQARWARHQTQTATLTR